MRKIGFFIVSLVFSLSLTAQIDTLKTALILVDIQDFYFPGGKAELVEPEKASLNAQKVLELFREKGLPVIHVRHNFEPGGDIHESVKPLENEIVITKNFANSFRETELLHHLQELEIEQVVVIGMQTHMCLEATTRAAADFGYKCIVVEDACATKDLKYGDRVIKAEDVHYSTLNTLSGSYAKVMNLEKFIEENK